MLGGSAQAPVPCELGWRLLSSPPDLAPRRTTNEAATHSEEKGGGSVGGRHRLVTGRRRRAGGGVSTRPGGGGGRAEASALERGFTADPAPRRAGDLAFPPDLGCGGRQRPPSAPRLALPDDLPRRLNAPSPRRTRAVTDSLAFPTLGDGDGSRRRRRPRGLHLGSSSLAITMTNMIPAITFAMALAVGVAGAVAIVLGLYVVLWGKAEDVRKAAPSANAQLDPENTLAAPLIAETRRAHETNRSD
ncbi:hypothetical protein PR202_ga15796 [Eleusine coracana subsp. coracana]|uniref:Uncharacterized protein n=1 Tax=Eleusine coracana subsp. coracana TaxID=191504 RepID=A0AAV5CKU1_ELECO|nr:hypothetical protein PR202_ga15796 [Eleusine coracana subsp. coracana]